MSAENVKVNGVEFIPRESQPFAVHINGIEFVPVDQEPRVEQLELIREALDEYHQSLTAREHGGVASGRFVRRCENILKKYWQP